MAYSGIRLSDKSKSEIQSIAKDLDKTVSDITRELIEIFLVPPSLNRFARQAKPNWQKWQ